MIFTNGISRTFGKFASKEFPRPIQNFINSSYVKLLGLDMSEFQKPSEYKTLNKLFTRELQKNREFSKKDSDFLAPADSLVTEFGNIENGLALQIKGMEYSVSKLLGEENSKLENGTFMNFYLSPKDYHHYHMPYSAKVKKATHFTGKLYPVNIKYLNKQVELFVENERVVLECKTENGKIFYMILVGALNVGEMVLHFEPKIETNKRVGETKIYEYSDLHISKGEDLGFFKMGSTVLIIAEKEFLKPNLEVFEKVKFGQIVAEVI